MINVKDLAYRYLEDQTLSTLSEIAIIFLNEVDVRAHEKNVKSNISLVPVIDSLSRDWVEFSNFVNGSPKLKDADLAVNPVSFLKVLRSQRSDVYVVYINTKVAMEHHHLKNTQ